MIFDALVSFVPLGAPLSMVAGAGVSIRSQVYDMLGAGVGVAPPSIIGNAALFGTDMGVGGKRPELNITIGTTLTTGTAATLNIALQAAPDTAVTFQPGTWVTLDESGPIAVANLVAGAVPFRTPFIPTFPPGLRPRYLSLLFQVPAATDFTAGTILSALVTMVRDDQANKFAASNFVVA